MNSEFTVRTSAGIDTAAAAYQFAFESVNDYLFCDRFCMAEKGVTCRI
jgi:hypothetical protein